MKLFEEEQFSRPASASGQQPEEKGDAKMGDILNGFGGEGETRRRER